MNYVESTGFGKYKFNYLWFTRILPKKTWVKEVVIRYNVLSSIGHLENILKQKRLELCTLNLSQSDEWCTSIACEMKLEGSLLSSINILSCTCLYYKWINDSVWTCYSRGQISINKLKQTGKVHKGCNSKYPKENSMKKPFFSFFFNVNSEIIAKNVKGLKLQ